MGTRLKFLNDNCCILGQFSCFYINFFAHNYSNQVYYKQKGKKHTNKNNFLVFLKRNWQIKAMTRK